MSCTSASELYLGSFVAENCDRVYKGNNLIFNRTSGLDPLIDDYLAKCALEGYTPSSGDELTALNQLILDLTSTGIINPVGSRVPVSDFIDVLYVPATNNSSDSDAATLNLLDVDNHQLTKVNSPLYGVTGFTGDGISAYLDTNYNPFADSINYSLNSASSIYGGTIIGSAVGSNQQIDIGVSDASNNRITHTIQFNVGGPNDTILRLNQTGPFMANGILKTDGSFHIVNRSGSLGTDVQFWNDDIEEALVILGGSGNSESVPNANAFILAVNNNGTAQSFSTRDVSIAAIGADISTKRTDFFNAFETYKASIGI